MEALLENPDAGASFMQFPDNTATLAQIRGLAKMAEGADQGAVGKIIQMLKDIASNLQASIDAETFNETDAVAHFDTVKASMNNTIADLRTAKAALDAEI